MRNSTWCWRSCAPASCSAASRRCPACGRRSGWPRTARRPRRRRRRRGRRPRTRRRAAGVGMGPACRRHAHRQRRCRRHSAVRGHRGGAAAGGHRRRDRPDPARAGRPVHRGGPVRVAAARPGQRAAHRSQLLLGRPEGGAVAAGVGNRCGDGGFAAGPLPRGLRPLAAVGRAVGVGHLGDAHLAATTSPKCLRCSGSGRCGTTRRAGW